jgi:hypothetical protein
MFCACPDFPRVHNTTKNLENIRKHPKDERETPFSGFMTSLLVTLTGHMTFGHVTSRSHIGHAQRYILYYYYSKRAENPGMRRTYFRDVTSGHAQWSDFPEI